MPAIALPRTAHMIAVAHEESRGIRAVVGKAVDDVHVQSVPPGAAFTHRPDAGAGN